MSKKWVQFQGQHYKVYSPGALMKADGTVRCPSCGCAAGTLRHVSVQFAFDGNHLVSLAMMCPQCTYAYALQGVKAGEPEEVLAELAALLQSSRDMPF